MYSGRASGSGRSSLISESSRTCAAGPISRRRTIKERSRDRPCVSWARTQVSFSVGDVYVCVCVSIRKRDPVADLRFMADSASKFFSFPVRDVCVFDRERNPVSVSPTRSFTKSLLPLASPVCVWQGLIYHQIARSLLKKGLFWYGSLAKSTHAISLPPMGWVGNHS